MDRRNRLLLVAHPDFKIRIRLVVAHHGNRHGVRITRIQITRHLDIVNVGILALRGIVNDRKQLHAARYDRRSRIIDIAARLPSVREDHDAPRAALRDHREASGYRLLDICCRLIRCRKNSGIVLLPRHELLHHRLLAKGHDSILIAFWHLTDFICEVRIHIGQIRLVARRCIDQKNRGV